MERLGQKIRERRNMVGLTLRELSSRLGISLSTLHKIEKGIVSPTVVLMVDICHELDPPIYTLIKDKNKKKIFVHIKKDEQKELVNDVLTAKLIADKGLISDDINFIHDDVIICASDTAPFDKPVLSDARPSTGLS